MTGITDSRTSQGFSTHFCPSSICDLILDELFNLPLPEFQYPQSKQDSMTVVLSLLTMIHISSQEN